MVSDLILIKEGLNYNKIILNNKESCLIRQFFINYFLDVEKPRILYKGQKFIPAVKRGTSPISPHQL
jgi:hypothetical protein